MRRILVLAWILGIALSCNDGGGGNDSLAKDAGTWTPEESNLPECTKTKTCEWGKWCKGKVCVRPEGMNKGPAFDFTAQDQCPTSKTYGKEISLSDWHGSVVLLYFAITTCDACKADVREYESIVKQMEYKGFVGMASMITVILPMSASALAEFSDGLQFPVVVDSPDVGIASHYQASKDTVVLIDGAGYVRYSWPHLEVRGSAADRPKLNEKLAELVTELQGL